MQVPDSNATLRPLGIGEVLDRAVNLCVKHFLPLATIYVVYAIPIGVITFFSSQGLAHIVQAMTDQVQAAHGKLTAEGMSAALAASPGGTPLALLLVLIAVFGAPLPAAALIEATTALYLERTSSFGQAYRVALDRYFPMLGVTLLYGLCALAIYGVVIVVAIFLIVGLFLITSAAKTAGIVLSVALGCAFVVAGIAFALVAVLAWQIAYFTCVVERATFSGAFVTSLKRTFSSIGLKRSLSIGAVFLALSLVLSLVTLGGEGIIVGLLHSTALATAYETLVRIATAAFTTAFVAIFYIDLRVREEGLDLQLQAQRLAAPIPEPG